ncbi:cobalamin biosynthesis protein [Nocardia caishijiensis]|uniref:Cobalt-precorrin 5A hydrolase n=1 Tax=Nocardia caishijiensis TaxID=184756 RepID=A0ABQ6YPQ6_9NOCA|nr:cobalamin biosynthesis protein [Nocardia caishijiensis]KAF0847782.1 cobalt-precorrin 5A hydrolase [Nocardia caishijiensis]
MVGSAEPKVTGQPDDEGAERAVAVGIGVRPGTTADRIVRAVEVVVGQRRITCLATLDTRAAEPDVRAAATILGVTLLGFTAEQLSAVTVAHSSSRTAAAVGTPSVAEAAALLAANGESVDARTIVDGIVVAMVSAEPN